ncbi:alpha/beta fold hydrolase [Pseudomonas sp. JS3066]|jgi:ABC-2 type transport system ATP-binding protein|uniref:alpha/beta hydrolase n=1 Tax=unclassified Pseudomonas TaxID=196821 RepID=UPI000EAAAF48|nr:MULTISPECIES: alpha/beta fold hydrolase [unclassified Pseudomonas]AYF86052.1 peptidase S15 [Pseudomonas sp. DY-1]WVK91360.1 alpha/beta fold hydrolase [Pseudomonas sp. JS3066]
MRLANLLLALLLLGGCAAREQLPDFSALADRELPATHFETVITARDGTRLSATVFQPALKPGEQAPLVVHTHGWGGWRVTGPEGFYGQQMMSGRAALKAWRAGFWVISYDQRGWGGSDGNIQMMDPRYEVQDALAVIDWAVSHLPRLSMDGPGDPRVGMLGESYGGAVQLLASAEDPRINAIVPIATWYDLSEALAPGGHMKVGWTGVLLGLGLATGYDLGKFTQAPYLRSASGEMTPQVQAELKAHSLASYCQRGQRPHADALLIQGMRDTLFPLDQGLAIRECLHKGEADVRLLGMQGGHILPPPLQRWSGLPPFNNEPVLHCGDRAINLYQAVVAWYEDKLRGRPGAADSVPNLCLSLDLDHGLALNQLPQAGAPQPLPETRIRPLTSGWLRPSSFIPLRKVDVASGLVGSVHLELDRKADAPLLFASLAVRRVGGKLEALSEQSTPINARQVDLAASSALLQPGDELGLQVSGFSGQYLFNSSWSLRVTTLKGLVSLPPLLPLDAPLASQ